MLFTSSLLLGTLGLLCLAGPLPPRSIAPTVHLQDTDIWFTGIATSKIESFLNIRFGEDTSGNNRFAPPKSYAYPAGSIVNATQAGTACPQRKVPLADFPVFDNLTNISEDCLTLRIERPINTSASDRLPVLVFIYGGGDTIGQIYDSAYEPSLLVAGAAQRGLPIVYVAMNYRLGVFGFASSPALNESDSLNVGLLDQRLALWWIQDHIEAFGGDPDRVTIFGESDGATGVGLQLTAYGGQESKVPFRRAIMQSGGASADPGTATTISAQHTAELIEMVNCTSHGGSALSKSREELQCLRQLALPTLLSTANDYELTFDGGLDVFFPTSPSTFVPDSPSTLLKTGHFARGIDIISGWCENDASLFTPTRIASSSDVSEYLLGAYSGLSNATIKKALELYPVSQFSNDTSAKPPVSAQYFRASRMQRDLEYTCVSLLTAEANARYATSSHVSNYLYVLNQTIFSAFFEKKGVPYYGVSHFSDIPYIFNSASHGVYGSVATESDRQLASAMGASWASFATFGDPSRGNGTITGWSRALPAGAGLGPSAPQLRVLGGSTPGNHYNEQLMERCAFWNSPHVLAEIGV
ncbi:carboxylesterase family protein [Aspergillus homomorphus CBS 101889]|uniref:Carboxylesterase family protein n=1 Tax=Aspergillus homomorphus (strain CBS 101889) TaxID=1450537 RepID=A0A395IAR3_ASPHC|nr:carboxylesterase family protein [Aspergillus homomorphus CBS 101889]RAL16899.1 carboxylesterase family protein [Aspergillus homomorphus CBS 101889]